MKISLSGFEHQIDETILKRGLDYHRKGHVTDVDESGDGEYEMTVEGSETYTVNLKVRGDAVTGFECDCPYDRGPVCKHVAAALFYLQKDTLATLTLPTENREKKPKEKSVARQAEELLDTLSHDELRSFVRNVCASDDKFRQLFVARHIHILFPVSKELYAKQVRALVNTCSDRHGFIDYSAARHLGRAIEAMTDDAKNNLNEGRIRAAMFIALAVAEETVQALNCGADDSDGELGSCIDNAFGILEMLTGMMADEALHDELFDHLIGLFEEDVFRGWHWHFNTVGLAIGLVKTPREKERIKTALGRIKPGNDRWDWDYSRAQESMLALIRKTEDEESATRYMEENLSNSDFRVRLIEAALKAKDYGKAGIMAQEGMVKDEKDAPGLADQWRNYLLTIARETGDTEDAIRLARYCLIHSGGRHHPLKYYYDVLKDSMPSAQWPGYLENLISGIKVKSGWIDYDLISRLYIWEARWDSLLDLLRRHVSLERIAEAERYLADSYPDELAALYKDRILVYVGHNMGRSHYQTACSYIRRMIKLGARPMSAALIDELKNTYPGRRALIEELNKI